MKNRIICKNINLFKHANEKSLLICMWKDMTQIKISTSNVYNCQKSMNNIILLIENKMSQLVDRTA